MFVRASGGGTVSAAQVNAAVAASADIVALNASQAAQDALIAAAPTQVQVDALQAVQDAEDPYTSFTRQPDDSIDWARESGATGTIAAPTAAAVLTDPELASITDPTTGLVSGQSLFQRDFTRQGQSTDFTATNGQELIPKPWAATRLEAQYGNRVQKGTTAEKIALGIVDPNTPFFDTVLGNLQRYNTSTEIFSVTKSATDLPALVEFAGLNSVFSAMQFKITTSLTDTVDNPTITLPNGQDTLLYIIGRQFFNGSVAANTLGGGFTVRNDNGILTLVSIEPNRHWGPGLDWNTIPYTDLTNTVAGGISISLADVNTIFANVPGVGEWVDADGTAESVSLPDWTTLTPYEIGDRVVAPMPINANFIVDNNAVVGVDYIFEANTARPDTVTAFDDVEADSGAWDLVGVYRNSGLSSRTLTGAGTLVFNPITDLSNTSLSEFIHWHTTDTPKNIMFTFDPALITVWKDYTGLGLVQPAAINDVFAIPANVQMWARRSGNAVHIIFESNESTGGVATTQQIVGTALLEDRGIFREIDDFVSTGGTIGTVTFPDGGFSAPPPGVQTTAQNNGHTINVNNITATGFSYDQWDVEDVKQGGAFSYSVKGLKP